MSCVTPSSVSAASAPPSPRLYRSVTADVDVWMDARRRLEPVELRAALASLPAKSFRALVFDECASGARLPAADAEMRTLELPMALHCRGAELGDLGGVWERALAFAGFAPAAVPTLAALAREEAAAVCADGERADL